MLRWLRCSKKLTGFYFHNRIKRVRNVYRKKKTRYISGIFLHMVEHRRFELLTPTMPLWCATSCANAPRRFCALFALSAACGRAGFSGGGS